MIRTSKIPFLIAILILFFSFVLMAHSSKTETAIMDELAHIPAGYSYLKFGDNRLNPEHPPLTKDISAIPLLFTKLNFPLDSQSWQTDVNGQWETGAKFLYESGNDADKIINLSRIGPILLTILTGFIFYLFSRKRLGSWWALLPLFLFSLSPLVLAHGHYVTTDMAAAFGVIIALWSFVNYLKKPNKKTLIAAGLCFGLAQLCKFSLLILIPLFIVLTLVFYTIKLWQNWPDIAFGRRKKEVWSRFFKALAAVIGIFIIGYFLVYLVYLPQNINYPKEKQKADTETLLASFAGGPDPNWQTCQSWSGSLNRQIRCLANIDIWMAQQPIFKPLAQYALGALMVTQRSSAGNTGYFLGQVSAAGWRNYFPTVFAIKEQIPSLIFLMIALMFSFVEFTKAIFEKSRWPRFLGWIWQHFSEFSALCFIIFYWITSSRSPLNIGFRHLLPTLPLTYLLVAYEIKKWWRGEYQRFFLSYWEEIKYHFKKFGGILLKTSAIGVLLLWYLVETVSIAPNFIAYFNELVGGAKNGYKYVVDSNLDWGQDMKKLTTFVEQNKINKIKVDYFGGTSPKYYLGEKFEPWSSSKGQPETNSWLAVSLTFLQNSQGQPVSGFKRKAEDGYSWLQDKKPFSRIGYSMFIYKF